MGFFDFVKSAATEVGKYAKDNIEQYSNLKELYQSYSDDELIRKFRVGDSSKDNLAILSVLKDRGYDSETIKNMKNR